MMPRVISLLPAATDIVATLGAADRLVGVTHECDYPDEVVSALPRVTASPIHGATAGEIDEQVRAAALAGASLFELHEAQIRALRPDVLFTQALCDVCAVNETDVRAIAARLAPTPRVVTLGGTTIDGVLTDIGRVADALGIPAVGEALVAQLHKRLGAVHETVCERAPSRPRVAVLEWTDPMYAAAHWVPEMVARAGGVDVLSVAGAHSTTRTIDDIRNAAPELLCVAPCGYDVPRAEVAAMTLLERPEWRWARSLPVWVLNGNVLTSRPGPRIVDGVEVMAAVFHPELFPTPLPHNAIRLTALNG